jgi:hypothetical protein
MKKYLFVILGVCTVSMSACYYDHAEELYPAGNCDVSSVTYSATVSKIMQLNCALSGCHDANTASGGYALDSYNGVAAAANSGALIGAVKHDNNYSPMPQNAAQLDACTINKLQTWVTAGALNN